MCLILLGYHVHPLYRLILIANRDEFYARKTAPLNFWEDHPDVLGGRDLEQMGTWLGISRSGRVAAITNYREPEKRKINTPSRGHLVSRYLIDGDSPNAYLQHLVCHDSQYSGFNLIVGDPSGMQYRGNRSSGIVDITAGWHSLSNHLLNTPWPKTQNGLLALKNACQTSNDIDIESLFKILADDTPTPDDLLPDTGIELAWERILSAIFIKSPYYGTRSSSIILIDHQDYVQFWERFHPTFDSSKIRSETRYLAFKHRRSVRPQKYGFQDNHPPCP